MPSILFVTVGGSHQPIVTAINSLNPDRVIFICSVGAKGSESQVTGEGSPCEVRRGSEVVEKLPNIPTQASLGERFQADRDMVRLHNPDDLSECYQMVTEKIRQIRQESPDATLLADYTGGTKTMSLALGLAAIDYQLQLFLTTAATRENLIRVERGESTELAPVSLVTVERKIEQTLPTLLQQYNYPAAIAELRQLLQSLELPSEQKRYIRELRDCCAGLDAWDRFDHVEAWNLLQPQMRRIQPLGLFLKRVMSSRAAIDDAFNPVDSIPGHGYEIVEDLLLNAERRVMQQRYDDAVGRIYRALELLAQIRLYQAYGIRTGDIDLAKLPELLQDQYTSQRSPVNGKIQLALQKSYELLSQLSADPLGDLYEQRKNAISDTLQIRNHSLFAHGFQPITSNDYQKVKMVIVDFIQQGVKAVTSPNPKFQPIQFPLRLF
ncbi:TIGR02710 family CRISPR-associated CARF protein [Pantanalinema rosaneae CENA516]|uniref:TIGR02710 family CRISPR-associated CARF protein n=1 Tax=Pantanalinema rosaneae TaxID=1620701 RepID=UPI003D6E86FE